MFLFSRIMSSDVLVCLNVLVLALVRCLRYRSSRWFLSSFLFLEISSSPVFYFPHSLRAFFIQFDCWINETCATTKPQVPLSWRQHAIMTNISAAFSIVCWYQRGGVSRVLSLSKALTPLLLDTIPTNMVGFHVAMRRCIIVSGRNSSARASKRCAQKRHAHV